MSDSWRIATDFDTLWGNTQKRLMRQERRPSITSAAQILGPGAGPFAILLSDWNEEAGTFNGIFYSVPGAFNAPPPAYDAEDPTTFRWWLGETFGVQDEEGYRWGFQRLTRYYEPEQEDPIPVVTWSEYRRRFYPQGELVAYTAWEAV